MSQTPPRREPPRHDSATGLLRPGDTVWRVERAHRLAFLIDTEAYFAALRHALAHARRWVGILSWDIDGRVMMQRDKHGKGETLADLLNRTCQERDGLEVRILNWDFAMIFALERQPLPLYNLGWRTHKRVDFRMDGFHPLGASHHQKVVVVDGRLAFTGGIDLAQHRWDTPEHKPHDPRRVNPSGEKYGPYHDVQAMVTGPAAAALGDLFLWRWKRATGENLHLGPLKEPDGLWPEEVPADAEGVDVGLSRTLAPHHGEPRVREVLHLHLEAIAAAKTSIYMENQYLTSKEIGQALAARLKEEDGPEVVLVLPQRAVGWLEESTMSLLRLRLLEHLRRADRHGRLKVYYPTTHGLKDEFINVHSKVLVVDDVLAKVGSSNASNRSMGLDSECDLVLDGRDQPGAAQAIAGLRARLLGEHLGVKPEKVAAALERDRKLIAAVESLRGGKRTLAAMDEEPPDWVDLGLVDGDLLDPERPLPPEDLMRKFLPEEEETVHKSKMWGLAALVAVVLGLAAAWHWGPLSGVVDEETLVSWAHSLRQSPWLAAAVVGAYVAGGMVLLPVSLLIIATGLVFDHWQAPLYALAGTLASAGVSYGVGRLLGRATVRRLSGEKLNRLSRRLARHGIINVAILRNLPIAPFTVINLVAGVSYIKLKDFLAGTALGMAPGILLLTLLSGRIERVFTDPSPLNVALMIAAAGALFLAGAWFKKSFFPARTAREKAS